MAKYTDIYMFWDGELEPFLWIGVDPGLPVLFKIGDTVPIKIWSETDNTHEWRQAVILEVGAMLQVEALTSEGKRTDDANGRPLVYPHDPESAVPVVVMRVVFRCLPKNE